MIEATLTITARYLEGEKVDIPDVERVLQAAVDHVLNRGHLSATLDMPIDEVATEIEAKYYPETQQKLEIFRP
jgi:hypothetical protein